MAMSTKLAYQGYIQNHYPELVKQYTQELCTKCAFSALGFEGCSKDLLPVTLKGEPCPYQTAFSAGAARAIDPRKVLLGRR